MGTTTRVRQASGIPETLKSIFGRARGGKKRRMRVFITSSESWLAGMSKSVAMII